LEYSYGVDLVFIELCWQLSEMQGHLCHVVAVVFECARAFARDAHALLHQGIQRFKACYFSAGAVNQILFFMGIKV